MKNILCIINLQRNTDTVIRYGGLALESQQWEEDQTFTAILGYIDECH